MSLFSKYSNIRSSSEKEMLERNREKIHATNSTHAEIV